MIRNIFILTIIFSFTILFADGWPPSGGAGTEENPYWIGHVNNLLWISTNPDSWDKHFVQYTTILADTEDWNNGEGFSPIGNTETSFTGSYNGQLHGINGLYINRSESFNQGLFGHTTNSTIENIVLNYVNIMGSFNAGGLVAHSYNSTIENCYADGIVTGSDNVGGIVGIAEGSSLRMLESLVDVTADEFLGSLIGQCYQTSLENCSSFGSVEGIGNLGGLAGLIFDSEVNNCFSHSNVDAFMSAGGFAGVIMNGAVIDKCYSIGSVVNGVADIGGFIGMNINANAYNSFWDTEISGLVQGAGGVGKTTAQMQEVYTFTDVSTIGLNEAWDFVDNPFDDTANEDIWYMSASYPYLFTPFPYAASHEEVVNELTSITMSNYPNPFNPQTTISFETTFLQEDARIEIYNTKGQKVDSIPIYPSTHSPINSVVWNSVGFSSGVYFYKLTVNGKTLDTKKMLLLK